jgi:hypothetical protein
METIIICVTILIISILIFILGKKKIEANKEILNNLNHSVDYVISLADRYFKEPIPLNEEVKETLVKQDELITDLILKLKDYDSLKDTVKDMQGRVSTLTVGRSFTPTKRG